jgi:hypothetical protein
MMHSTVTGWCVLLCNPKIGGCNGGGSGKENFTKYSLGF